MTFRYWRTRWLLISLLVPSAAAAAQEVEPEPGHGERYLATWSAGVPLRLAPRDEFGQDALAPAFTDVLGGYVFAGGARLRHGVGVGASLNLAGDGGFAEPVYSADQLAIMPAYLLYGDFGPDWFGLGHLGVPIVVTGGSTAGAELAAALGYRLLAGTGLFAELSLDAFVGAGSKLHPTMALELGLFLDYEVLP